ncbi:hypothetical protein [Halobaculum gomorrense]|uniref:Uncharacterized protein n=1 Tax=Halobaculum gomorrense TaxID=43928 RepID=A0A1M5JKM5_9EURY|nr:hypothetical protein [Halobaculum gomorrense]SHG41078.1 hypothetical protein SAMN05443636_0152 [Halobaculum gomorrense]
MGTGDTRDKISRRYPTSVAVVVYAALCIPLYFWLEGPVGEAGTVDGSVAAIGLIIASIMFVPVVRAGIRRMTDPNAGAR